MTRIVIRGYAAVKRHGEAVTDPTILRTLAGLVADGELFTEYLGPGGYRPTPEETALAGVLEPGGSHQFQLLRRRPATDSATTEYTSRRPLTPEELRALVLYTMGQWSDGIGENLEQCPIHDEYDLQCLWSKDVVEACWPVADLRKGYPAVEVTGPPEAVQSWQQMVAGEASES